ncbi:uncharacterized protein LOC133311296 [Gastrolobium bilobum]|uniref:uncharacterized protein LOC133311296 n=1 Tax=Gastrolobium bilobum TaxID=150636 RepID=UPI002AAF2B1D|nr:uncharacterized protein LOC133311296 [Gastrolobium bilobum]
MHLKDHQMVEAEGDPEPKPLDLGSKGEGNKGRSKENDSIAIGGASLPNHPTVGSKGKATDQGAANPKFGRTLKMFVNKNDVNVVVLLETRAQSDKCSPILKKLKFDKAIFEEANGFSDGLWFIWDSKRATVSPISQTSQFIHMKIEINHHENFLCTAVYASPRKENKQVMWDEVRNLSQGLSRFADFLEDCHVEDVKTSGSSFTWQGPKWNHLDRVFKKLDRACANIFWRLKYENVEVRILPRLNSDHNPLLIKNKTVFGDIHRKKENLSRKIADIQQHRTHSDSQFLQELEKQVQIDLDQTLVYEELLWFQKSRHSWLVDGDKNTRFYHSKAVIRRSINKVSRLRRDAQVWIEDPVELVDHVCRFFENLSQEENQNRR